MLSCVSKAVTVPGLRGRSSGLVLGIPLVDITASSLCLVIDGGMICRVRGAAAYNAVWRVVGTHRHELLL